MESHLIINTKKQYKKFNYRPKWPNITVWKNMYGSTTICKIIRDLPLF